MGSSISPIDEMSDRVIRQRFVAGIDRMLARFGRGGRTILTVLVCILMAATIVLIPAALAIAWRSRRDADVKAFIQLLRGVRTFGTQAQPVVAFPLMVNNMLRSPGDEPAPGLFLLSFDAAASTSFMSELAIALSSDDLSGQRGTWSSAQRAFARELLADEEFKPFRRRKIPPEMAGGPDVYACDLMIHPLLLAGHHIGEHCPLVPCLAAPGDTGRALVIPWWLATDTQAKPTPEESEAFEVSLVHFEGFSRSQRK